MAYCIRPAMAAIIAVAITFTLAACNEPANTFIDGRDSKTYKWVKIGEQTWMAENLKYDAKGSEAAKNGRLYDWATAMALPAKCNKSGSVEDVAACKVNTPHKGICPAGWHIPTYNEWEKLLRYAGDDKNLKAKSGWECVENGTDKYGFSAVPSGVYGVYSDGFWWTADDWNECEREDDEGGDAGFVRMACPADGNHLGHKAEPYSIRCVKDDGSKPIDYSSALQMHFPKGTLGESGKTRPVEMFFQKVSKNGRSYSVSGKSKTKAAEDAFSGTLTISASSKALGDYCGIGENEIKGSYDLSEKESKTSGHFVGSFIACENHFWLKKASFKGSWVKHSNGEGTPCNFGL